MSVASPSILLVEDNEDDAFFIRRAFQSLGLQISIHHVRDAQEAIEYLDSGQGRKAGSSPLLVVLDLKIRQKSGFAVLEWIRAHEYPDLMVIILTASNAPVDIEKAETFNVEAYLIKPASLGDTREMARCICHLWLDHLPEPLRGSLFHVSSGNLETKASL